MTLHFPGQFQIVRHHNKAGVQALIQFLHQVKQCLCTGAIQIAGGFVSQHTDGLGNQRAGHRHALAFAAGKFGRVVRQTFFQAHVFQHFGGNGGGLFHFHAAYQERHGDVFQRGEFRQQVVELVDEAERAVAQLSTLGFIHRLHVLAEYRHAAAAGIVQPAEQMQQGAFAGAGSTDDGDAFAAGDIEINAVEHGHVEFTLGKGLAQVAAGNNR